MGKLGQNHPYEDIIHLDRPRSSRHVPMSIGERAAQFAPFAALTGYDAAVRESARLTDKKVQLDEDALADLDRKHHILWEHWDQSPMVTVVYFQSDPLKAGGCYCSQSGRVRKIDLHQRTLTLEGGLIIGLDDIVELESELFE